MLDDFFVRALLAATGVAVLAGPLGCFVVWNRMAYFGDTLAHAALLGVGLGLLLGWHLPLGVLVVSAGAAMLLLLLQQAGPTLATDTLLGILSHASLSLGLVLLGLLAWVRVDLMAYLFGDVLAVSASDVAGIWLAAAAGLAVLAAIWRPLLAITINEDLARAEGIATRRYRVTLMLLVAAVIAVAMQVVGILLITSLLIIPAAGARAFARSPEQMAVIAALLGTLASVAGLFGSLRFDTPSGPSIVVAAAALFGLSLLARRVRKEG